MWPKQKAVAASIDDHTALSQDSDHPKDSVSSSLENVPMVALHHDPLPPAVDYSGVRPTAKYQFRALGRRALSYHRKQRISNIFCLVIWPVLLVVLCFIFSIIGGAPKTSNNLIRFCTNEADPATSYYFQMTEAPRQTMNTAWYYWNQYTDNYNEFLPCVRWFGKNFPRSAPYAVDSGVDQPDNYYIPAPAGGWFNYKANKTGAQLLDDGGTHYPVYMTMVPVNQTAYFSTAPGVSFGTAPANTQVFHSNVWPPTDPKIVTNSTTGTGAWGNIPVHYTDTIDYGYAVWHNLTDPNSPPMINFTASPNYIAAADLDATIAELVNKIAASGYSDPENNDRIFGGVAFNQIDMANSKVDMRMQFGLVDGHYYSDRTSAGLNQIITLTQMTTAMVKSKFGANYTITQGLRALPSEWNSKNLSTSPLDAISAYLFPFGLMFLLPTFVAILVSEKEDKHRMMMSMNGLKPLAYYSAHYFEFMTMQLILSFFFAIACLAVQSNFIWRTNPLLNIIMFVVWAHTLVCMAFFIASFFSRARKASLLVYFLVAMSATLANVSEQLFSSGKVPFAWYIYPPFSFFDYLKVAARHASRSQGLYPLSFLDFAPGTDMFKKLIMMLCESVVLVILTFYIDAVLPSEYGVQRPWHFPITGLFTSKKSFGTKDVEAHSIRQSNSDNSEDKVLEGADADVYAERERVQNHYDPAKTPLIIDNLYHIYSGKPEPALRGMSFGVETNTVLGLLGPNGAGKSTLIHLLVGLYSPTSGTAYVAGANIRTDMSTVHGKIGVCPQHDILWEDLTVKDHLLFYARLRGIPPHLEQAAVEYSIASVSLTMFTDRQVKGLSGGEKRRVSIAIALLGDNEVVFLDEPSTGLDPEVRRVIWDIINRVKVGRTIVLTTHSMEEADILSDKICIMTLGSLRCMGTSLHLKNLYGAGFRLNVSSQPGRLNALCQQLETEVIPKPFKRIDKFTNSTTYEFNIAVDGGGGELSRIFELMSRPGQFPDLEDFGVSQATLEDVFIKIVTDGDKSLVLPDIV